MRDLLNFLEQPIFITPLDNDFGVVFLPTALFSFTEHTLTYSDMNLLWVLLTEFWDMTSARKVTTSKFQVSSNFGDVIGRDGPLEGMDHFMNWRLKD